MSLSWDAVLGWRMRRQSLDPVGSDGVSEVARSLCGVQAQVPSSAEIEMLAETVAEVLDGRVLERDELIEEIAARSGRRDLGEHLRSGRGAALKPLAWFPLTCAPMDRRPRPRSTRG